MKSHILFTTFTVDGHSSSFQFWSTTNYEHSSMCLLVNICVHFCWRVELVAHRVYIYSDLRDTTK